MIRISPFPLSHAFASVSSTGGEVSVIGLGKSGLSSVKLLRRYGYKVYISDSSKAESVRLAAESAQLLGADITVGGHDTARILRSAFIVVSPGVPPDISPVVAARTHCVPVISEIELALNFLPNIPYIAVTGTNGKTTTTALIAHLLRALGHDAVEAGNIGTPLTEVALRDSLPAWIALELSSFQLHDTPSVNPTVGVLTNLTPDHLDRYSTVEEYYADKARLFANASSNSRWIINADDITSLALTDTIEGVRLYFSVAAQPGVSPEHGPAEAFYDRLSSSLYVLGSSLLPRAALPLLGDHNVANALAASLAVLSASALHRTTSARTAVSNALRSFRPPPHRLELVGEWNGVQWIDDSKATNVSSAYVAIDGMTRPTILLLGGRHKGEPYTALSTPIRKHVKRVIAYGESASIVQSDLRDVVPVDLLGDNFEAVMDRARSLALPGDTVLLSPACSSYDMFKNYEERGDRFHQLAQPSV